jgi:replicative DNA helicase
MLCPLDAERSVLGSILLVGGGPLPPTLSSEHFYSDRHRYLYAVIEALHSEDRGFDGQCVLRAVVARLPRMEEPALRARVEKVRSEIGLLATAADVGMLEHHVRLVVESACFRSLKNRGLELQDAALRGDVVAAGGALEAAQRVFGELVLLGGGPVFEVVREERAA